MAPGFTLCVQGHFPPPCPHPKNLCLAIKYPPNDLKKKKTTTLAALHSMQDLSSLTRDRTQAPCSESTVLTAGLLGSPPVTSWFLPIHTQKPPHICRHPLTVSSFLTFPLDQCPDITHVPQFPSPDKTFLGSPHPILSILLSSSIPVFLQEKSTQTASCSHPLLVGWASILLMVAGIP